MGSPKKRVQYRYDAVGNRVGMTDPDGGRFTYAWDAVNRISHLENPQGDRTTYAYDPAGQRTVKKLANGTRTSFSYDAASNLTRLANLKSDGTTISSFDYEYDRVRNRTAVLEADGSRVTWSYDDTHQLTGEHRTGSHPYRDTYTYDPSGNRLLKVHDGARTTYSYDASNQLEWSEDSSGRTTYTFDADGNQELVVEPSGDRTTTTWDYENRTTLVKLPSGIRNTMAYEPDGLRVKLEESTGTKKFIWDEQNYLAETDEHDDTQVVYTNEPRVYGNLISQRRGTDSHWYHFDAIGSTRALTDLSQTVSGSYLYDAWGNLLTSSGSIPNAFRFIGRFGYASDLLNRLYARERSYSPILGRWLSTDPFSFVDGPNNYIYVKSSPTAFIDPTGLACFTAGADLARCTPPEGGPHSVCYDYFELAKCEMLIADAARGATFLRIGCASQLLLNFRRNPPITPWCPTNCVLALESSCFLDDMTERLKESLSQQLTCCGSGEIDPPVIVEYGGLCQDPFKGSSCRVDNDDLRLGIGAVDSSKLSLQDHWECGPAVFGIGCCECDVSNAWFEFEVKDRYDFITTLPAPPPGGGGLIDHLGRCAAILEHAGIGHPFDTHCIIRIPNAGRTGFKLGTCSPETLPL